MTFTVGLVHGAHRLIIAPWRAL